MAMAKPEQDFALEGDLDSDPTVQAKSVVVEQVTAQINPFNSSQHSNNGSVHQVRSEQPEGRFRRPCRPCAPSGTYQSSFSCWFALQVAVRDM